MAKTKKEIEEWLKDFYKRQLKIIEKDDVWEEGFEMNGESITATYYGYNIIYIPQAIYDLLPEWEQLTWDYCSWICDDEGIGMLGAEGEEYADEEAKEEFGVDSVDDLNDCIMKKFYSLSQEDQRFWFDLGDQIKGTTGLPFEEMSIEGDL